MIDSDGIPFHSQYTKLTENLKAYGIAASLVTDGGGTYRVSEELVRLK
jgi:hypothetical protein